MAEVDLNELERYLRIFQENPDSRVFAPLADLYRRLGKLEEAEEICREGIRRHPYYAGGRVALAHILLDKGRLVEALSEADSVVTYYPDNLLARKILIRVLGGQNELERARREFEALRHLAPMVANDPEVERALHGPSDRVQFPETPSHSVANYQISTLQNSYEETAVGREQSLTGREQSLTGRDASIGAPPISPRNPTASQPRMPEWTQHHSQDLSPAVARSHRLATLLRKKLILDSLIQSMS